MSPKKINLIAIGYAKRALVQRSREWERMKLYASVLGEYHVIVFTRKSEGLPAFQQEGNLFLYGTNTKTRLGMLWQAYLIGKKIVGRKSDLNWVVSSQDPFETSVVGRAIARPPHTTHQVQIHGDVFNPHSYTKSFIQRVRFFYGRFVVRRTKSIRVVSERIKKSLIALGVAEERVKILPISTDLEPFLKVGQERKYVESVPVNFIYVGRFSSEKNLLMLLTAFNEVVRNNKAAQLTLVGDGPEINKLKNYIASNQLEEKVLIKSWTNDVATEMKSADVFCLASDHEGWGMVLVEAAAAGLAVITTDVGCAGEFIKNNENGIVVEVGNAEAYQQAVELFLDQPTLIEKYGKSAHTAAQKFTDNKTDFLQQFVDSSTG